MRAIDARHYLLKIGIKRDKVQSFLEYPFCLPVCRNLGEMVLHPGVTFLIGENGAGKSTLLEAIAVACGCNAEGGSRNLNFATRATHSCLHEVLAIHRGIKRPKDSFFLRAESFYNVATEVDNLMLTGYGDKSLHEQSHGEAFMALVLERFSGNGLYLLDEPEAALSPARQLALLSRVHQLVQANSQFIIATHSPILMSYPQSVIYSLTEEGVFRTEYMDTEHFVVTKHFLNNHKAVLEELLEE